MKQVSSCLEIKHLRMIEEIMRQGGLTAAADSLFVSQPALSRRLAQLEERLGQNVFNRVGKQLQLTPAGKALLRAAESILPELDRTNRTLDRIRSGREGSIRLCTECFTCYHWLPAVVAEFRQRHPGVEIEIHTDETANPQLALLNGRIDLGICSTGASDPRLAAQPLFRDQFVAVVPPSHRLAGRRYLKPSDLEPEHLVVYSATGSDAIERFLKPAGVTPRKVSSVSLTSGIIQMVRADLGIAFLTEWIVDQHPENTGLVSIPLSRQGLWRQWDAVTLKDYRYEPVSELVNLIIASRPNVRAG